MNSTVIVRRILLARAALLEIVPQNSIEVGDIHAQAPLPAIGLTEVSAPVVHRPLAKSAMRKVMSRVQVTVAAASPKDKDLVMREVRNALDMHIQTMAPFGRISSQLAEKGPEMPFDGADFIIQSQDAIVYFNESAE